MNSPDPAQGDALKVLTIAQQAQREFGLNSVVLRVSSDGREVLTKALGESMTGVPAEPSMKFRTGSVAIVYMGAVLLQLVDEGKASLDDPVSRWLPDVPHGSEITLRMLGSSTSGLHDYVTDPAFLAQLEAKPFRQWSAAEVIGIATEKPLLYEPGTNWSYSHANFNLLGEALEKISGLPLDRLLKERVYEPLELSGTSNQYTPQIPEPVLHAFTSERGTYEESTFWNPSWTTTPGAVLVQNICDLDRSARAVGTGELLSAKSFKTQLDPGTIGLGHPTASCPDTVCLLTNTQAHHFGLGVIVVNGWILTNPSFSGYAAIQAYLPAEKLAISVTVTQGPKSPAGNSAQTIAERISAALAPGHVLKMR
ncbi:serine hydrolase domain-containing protein [Streptomyces sp. NBC_01244]|uniref:serine hydrolase domain-containing protein n=1 Tax=Streptomyces sp. NBC_01244 TaxID=2903797 RepID=UPI002E13A4EC|nr:beta-lactamase family protein [Streptomyces sp. NBC_01244]